MAKAYAETRALVQVQSIACATKKAAGSLQPLVGFI
jgi:hypothetical protein